MLKTAEIGHLELLTPDDGKAYPCSRLAYTMALNQVPVVQVALDSGVSVLWWDTDAKPEELLEAINGEHAKLLPCSLVEYDNVNIEPRTIFKGYIVNGGAQYSDGLCHISLTCMGAACKLMATPGNLYVEAPMSSILKALQMGQGNSDGKAVTVEQAQASNNYLRSQTMNFALVDKHTKDMPIVDRAAVLVKAVRAAFSEDRLYEFMNILSKEEGKLSSDDLAKLRDNDVMAAFGGNTRLNSGPGGAIPPECASEWSRRFRNNLINAARGGGMYSAVASLTSPDFLLELVPRWSCDSKFDFKTEIKPITAWCPSRTETLDASTIIKFVSSRDSMAAVNTPDVVLAAFPFDVHRDEASAGGGKADRLPGAGVVGGAAVDPELDKKLKDWSAAAQAGEPPTTDGVLRVRHMPMPSWSCIMQQLPASQDAVAKRQQLANDVASAMLQYYYRSSDFLTVTVSPELRFGHSGVYYEDLLGERIVLDLSGNANEYARGLKAFGCLSEIRYEYAIGRNGASRADYTFTLGRAMFGDVKEVGTTLDTPVPLYKYKD